MCFDMGELCDDFCMKMHVAGDFVCRCGQFIWCMHKSHVCRQLMVGNLRNSDKFITAVANQSPRDPLELLGVHRLWNCKSQLQKRLNKSLKALILVSVVKSCYSSHVNRKVPGSVCRGHCFIYPRAVREVQFLVSFTQSSA